MKSDGVYKILEETKTMFLREAKNKLLGSMTAFIRFISSPSEEQRFRMENFFHSVKGTAAVTGYDEIRAQALEYEKFFKNVSTDKQLQDEEILYVLKGLADLLKKIEIEEEKRKNIQETNEESIKNLVKIEKDATKLKKMEPEKNAPKILIVEDVSVMIFHIKKHLETLDFQIFYAVDGQDAIQKTLEIKPDLILLDIMLPKIDGYEVCRQIKSNEETKHIKIIFVSSKAEDHEILKCYQVGADDFIPKPFTFVDLEKKVKRLLI